MQTIFPHMPQIWCRRRNSALVFLESDTPHSKLVDHPLADLPSLCLVCRETGKIPAHRRFGHDVFKESSEELRREWESRRARLLTTGCPTPIPSAWFARLTGHGIRWLSSFQLWQAQPVTFDSYIAHERQVSKVHPTTNRPFGDVFSARTQQGMARRLKK
jgi:hypothetical protein